MAANMNDDDGGLMLLSEDLLEEILVRVPTAKTLGQAKLVSKTWRQIISKRSFVLRHARRWSTKPQFLIADIQNYVDHSCVTAYLPLDGSKSIITAPCDGHHTSGLWCLGSPQDVKATVVATCSGLVIFRWEPRDINPLDASVDQFEQSVLMVGNPTTKSFLALPRRTLDFINHPFRGLFYWRAGLYCLAFDVDAPAAAASTVVPFKVVILERQFHDINSASFSIISSADLEWRRVVHSFHEPVTAYGRSVYCAGKVHWMASPGGLVVVFDTATDEASLLDHPRAWKPRGKLCLGSNADGRLSMASLEVGCIRVWTLTDYGGRGVWSPEKRVTAPTLCMQLDMDLVWYDDDKCVFLNEEEVGWGGGKAQLLLRRFVVGGGGGPGGTDQCQGLWRHPPPRDNIDSYLPYSTTMMTIFS